MSAGFELVAQSALEVVIRKGAQKFFKDRANRATLLVLEELRTNRVDPEEAAQRDEFVAMLVTFFMAMAQGASFKNLRIIAKVLAHKTANSRERTDDFIMWSNALAGLLHEEAVLLATLHRNFEAASRHAEAADQIHSRGVNDTKSELVGPNKLIADDDEFQALCAALSRTGFIILVAAWNGMSAAPSPRLARLAKMANLQDWADDAEDTPQ